MNFKSALPHLLAVIVFVVITLIFFHPVVLDGKIMTQNDIVQGVSSGQEVRNFRAETGEEALWTNSMFGGMPAYMINTYWSGDLTRYVHNFLSLYLPSPARYAFLGMLCFYILLLAFRVNPYLAVAGGIAYGLNSFTIVSIEAGHIWKVSAIVYMPLVLAGIQLILRKKTLLGISVASTAIALLIRSNHIQIAYYLFFVLIIFWIVHLLDALRNHSLRDFFRATAFIALAGIMGVSANLGKLWTAAEYSPYTIRGKSELTTTAQEKSDGLDKEYVFAWSNGVTESFTFLVPYLYGGGSSENVGTKSTLAEELKRAGANRNQIAAITSQASTYWGDQPFTSGPIYAGAVVIFLFVLAMLCMQGPVKYWLVIATVIGFMLSWGKNFELFNYFMFDYFPLYNKFRAVSMALVIPLLCIPLLSFVGLSAFLEKPDKKKLSYSLWITAGITLLILASSLFIDFSSARDAGGQAVLIDALESQRASMFTGSAFRSLVFILLSWGLVYMHQAKKLGQGLFFGLITLLIFTDLFMIDRKYLDKDKFSKRDNIRAYQADEADLEILKDESEYRVVNLTVNVFNDATTSYHHSSIGGYHGAKLRRYQDLMDAHLNNELSAAVSQLQAGNFNPSGTPVLNMLNTKYFKLGNTSNAVLTNDNALGNAWFVEEIRNKVSADSSIAALKTEDLSRVVISEELTNRTRLTIGSIKLKNYLPNHLTYSSTNVGDGFAVFSEIHYEKGWKAYLDEKEVNIHRVNYLLRGLNVPSGTHKIEFKFEPSSYSTGNSIMWVGSLSILALLVFSGIIAFKQVENA